MRIHTWTSVSIDLPASFRAIARIRCSIPGNNNKAALDWLPTSFFAATEEEARAKAQAHWDAEVARVAARKPTGTKKSTKAPAGSSVGDVI